MSIEKVDLTKIKNVTGEDKASAKQRTFEPLVMSVRGGKDPINQVTNSIVECHMADPGSTFVTSCC